MLEAVLSKWIMHYLKEYLKPLEPGQLELKVLQGSMKIYNLQLLPTALTVRHIPFIIRKGSVKYTNVIFPWNNLKNAACEVLIEDIFLVLQFENEVLLKSDFQADQKSLHTKNESNPMSRDEQIKIFQGLFESIIDNMHVQIKNLHVRIEFPANPKPIIIGLYTPEITFQTVDEQNNVVTTIQHPEFVHKQLLIKDFSIYFDTNQDLMEIKDDKQFQTPAESIQAFAESMIAMMKQDHQYLFNPTDFQSLLIHTKNKTHKITNQILTTIDEISLNLDLPQCRSIIYLNYIWSQFMKRRKYINCMRPKSFKNSIETWQYAHKCSILKNQPHVFKPYLALTILKSRLKYVELFKQAKVSKLSASLLGSPKQKLESLEKKIGQTASIYLREYSEAIYVKEESMKDHPDVTALDVSELKNIFESTELVFSMKQFAASFEINKFNLKLLYEKNSPLISMACGRIYGGMSTLEDGVNMNVHFTEVSVVSFINEMSRNIFQRIHQIDENDENRPDFLVLSSTIPNKEEASSFDCVIAPIKVTLDSETIDSILDFFIFPNQSKLNVDKGKTARFEIGELLQCFRRLCNYKMSIRMSQMSYDFPFKVKNDEIKYLTFEMANIQLYKNLNELVYRNAPQIQMNFTASLNLNAKIDTFTLLKTEDIKSKIDLVLISGKLGVQIDTGIELPTLQVFFPKECLPIVSYAVNSITTLPFVQSSVIANTPPPPILIVGRSKLHFDITLKALEIFLSDEVSENEMKLTIGDLALSSQYYFSSHQHSAILKALRITQYEKSFVEILDKIVFKLDRKNDSSPLTVDAGINGPHVYLDFKSIVWMMNFIDLVKQIFPKDEQIQLNQPIESVDPDKPIELIDPANIAKSIGSSKSDDSSFIVSGSRLRLTKGFAPSSMIITDSILTQSIDDFLQKSSAYEEFTPLIKSIENDNDDDDEEEDEEDYEEFDRSDSSSDDGILVPKEEENDGNMNFNFKVTDVLLEMLDRGDHPINSFFKMKSITLLDFGKTGFKLAFEGFVITRENRNIFKPSNFIVPIYMPEPIDIFIDFAESQIFPGDIMALSYDSPTIFQLMFGGKEPLGKNPITVNIFAKSGCGTFVSEKETIAITNVNNVSVSIEISTILNVDVKVKSCKGFYKEDNYLFVNMKDEFHCHYIGTLDDQNILVEIPNAKLSLKHVFLEWGMGFVPSVPIESNPQPLKIKLTIEPSRFNFLAKETQSDSNKFPFLETSSSNVFSCEPNEEYSRVFSVILGKTNCSAYRDKALDLNLDLDIEGIHINSDIFDHPIFGISRIHFIKNKRLIKSKIPSIEINFPISLLAQFANEASSFIPKDFTPSSSLTTDAFLPNFGVDLEMEMLSIAFYPTPKRALRLEMPSVKFILNSSHYISGVKVDSIKIFTIYHSDKPILVVNLANIQSILTFSEKTDYDLPTITIEDIKKLPQDKTVKHPLECLYFTYKMDLIQINYTHFFAKTLIDSIFKSMIDCRSLPSIPSIPIENFSKLGIKIDCYIQTIQFNFVIINPFASATFTGVKLIYNEKWEASIKNITLVPISNEGEKRTTQRSLITKKNENEDLVSITIQNGEFYAVLSEIDLYVDLNLLFSIIRYLMASPFLKVKPLLAEIKKSKDPNATIQKMDLITFSKTLPFAIILNLKKTDISVPITLEKGNVHELQIHISALVDANSSSLSINLSYLSLNFYDISTKTVFPSILPNFTTHFSIEIEEDSSLSFKANILDINLVFSAGDIYLLILLGRSIEKALNSQIYAFEETNFDIFQLRISSIELISAKMTFILCKDTRSSQVIPIFRCVIPPIMFKVKKTSSNRITKSPVIIDVEPYLEYFNVVTGNYDLIIEPISMHIYAYIIDEQMKFGADVLSNININFPLNAIMNIKDLFAEITESLANKQSLNYEDLPSMWLSNKLGSIVLFTVGKDKCSLEHDMLIPLYDIPIDAPISFSIDNKNYSIESNSFNYPTYLSRSILAVKKPYKGGMMISFERTYQIENNLSFALDLYASENPNKEFTLISTIKPHERQPLLFKEETYVIFTKQGESTNAKHNAMKLYLLDKSLSVFPINYENNKSVQCIKSVYNDTNIAARIIAISSQYLIFNLLPSTLYFKTDNNKVTAIKRGETTDFHDIENDTFTTYLSLDDKLFLVKKSHAKIDYKNTNTINIFNPELTAKQKCMIEFVLDKDIDQTTIILYMPVVIYNISSFILDFEISNLKGKQQKDVIDPKKNYSNLFEVLPKKHHYWCPLSLVNNSSDDSLLITVLATGSSIASSKPFDCLTTGRTTLFLPSAIDKDLFVPLRCNIANKSRTSVVTISPLITLVNNLESNFVLTPIRNIPSEIPENLLLSTVEGKTSICDKFGAPLEFPSKSETTIPYIPLNGTFSISIDGFSTSPSLSLLEPQKTVFKVQNKTNYKLIELQVTDIETGIYVEFNEVVFPTPILINNQLDIPINAFQLVYLTPFEIQPDSTSIFAFDEPFVYPSVTLTFGDKLVYRISLVEDTEKIEMRKKYNNNPVYVQVKHNKYGNRLVIISQKEDEPPEKYKFIFESSIYGIAASLIDLQMRETALIYLSKLDSKFTFNTEYLAVSVSLKSLQVDDQNPLAPHPTVIYGYSTENCPYLTFNCLCPINTSIFTSFDYFSISTQRIDVDADCSFISDWMNFATTLNIKTIHSIKPKKPAKSNKNSLIAFHYFEVTPALFILRYNRKSSRPPMLGKVPRFMKFIPSIKAGRMILPGIVLSRLTDRIDSIETKLIDDYKTAAFNAILGMLGGAGKILKMLGIASAIASSLNIKMTSDMTSEVSLNSFVKNTSSTEFLNLANPLVEAEAEFDTLKMSEFDNRFDDDELSSCFSYEALSSLMKKITDNSMNPSPLIQFTMPKFQAINEEGLKLMHSNIDKENVEKKLIELQKAKNEAIQQAGLQLKIMPGIGYGRGIAGVLTKELNDPLSKIEPMSYCIRIRETRPYAGAKISSFNPAIALAQKIIFKNGGLNEKAKEISVSVNGDKKIFIILTENTLYVFSDDLKEVIQSVKYSDIQKVFADHDANLVTLMLKNGKSVAIIIESKISVNFLLSILRMNHRFGESLLL
ncbi:hypothetical protein M9Y10_024436 [Tritrichomonas musculus]|uniref:Chorein N-terminal domain-containing protein n=1 Tax=Tritrichomonas musculus TaxID=1915356 RepID=A0ABR2HBX9_9EUKA